MGFKNILVAQSGGPTAVINATLSGVIRQCLREKTIDHVYGALNGIEGLLNKQIIDLKAQIKSDQDLDLLARTPSMALGSCRFRLPEVNEERETYRKIEDIFNQFEIGCFFYVGGNDSMDTAWKLSDYFKDHHSDVRVIGIPKTIDNDLPVTDHTPGYGSAAKYVATTMHEIIRDCNIYNVPAVTIVEVMGRHAGWLTAAAAVPQHFGSAAPHLIYLPETEFDTDLFLKDVRKKMTEHKAVIVAVSEGIKTKGGEYICNVSCSSKKDVFGHTMLSGAGKCLEHLVKSEIGCKVRSIELNIMQRCAGHLASACDVSEAVMIGCDAVRYAMEGHTGEFIYFERTSEQPYAVKTNVCDLKLVANQEKTFPIEWIDTKNHRIRPEGLQYILPLIRGELPPRSDDFLPLHFQFDKTKLV